ncbi:hypothetical protein MMC21_001297 [Puttea exsequens]|nr:hypothetical protein [Puttea exsequens]
MASSEVDQKFLGRFAKETNRTYPFLSSKLFQVLGLSVLLSKKLVRARRLRRLDTTRDTKSLQLYHHILWLAKEGLWILEEYILPMVRNTRVYELKVLAYKLRASFYHIFVLFHNQPSINQTAIPSFSLGLTADAKGKSRANRDSLRSSPPRNGGSPVKTTQQLPPGLAPISAAKPSASFMLPAENYIPKASAFFEYAATLADAHLSGSHPIRLSVKTEYSAYLYDCLHDGDASRKLAQSAIRDVYNAKEGMDDDMFEDAAELVGILGKMMKRGLGTPGSQGSSSTPRVGNGSTPATTPRSTPRDQKGEEGKTPPRSTPRASTREPKTPPRSSEKELPKLPSPRRESPRRRSPKAVSPRRQSPPAGRKTPERQSPGDKRSRSQREVVPERQSPSKKHSRPEKQEFPERQSSLDKRSRPAKEVVPERQTPPEKRSRTKWQLFPNRQNSPDKRSRTVRENVPERQSPSPNKRNGPEREVAIERHSPPGSRSRRQKPLPPLRESPPERQSPRRRRQRGSP